MDHWETFYRAGALAVCPGGSDSNYAREMRNVWVEFFGGLEDGARVLDVGTGNGAVALIAIETAAAAGRRYSVHGTDLALINPLAVAKTKRDLLRDITFHPATPTEKLPFDDGYFDAVSSQYAIEYSDPAVALREICRVLRPGARARLSVHHAESRLSLSARASLEESRSILESERIYRRLHSFIVDDSTARSGGVSDRRRAQRSWNELIGALQRLPQSLPHGGHVTRVTLDAVSRLLDLRQTMSALRIGVEIDRVERELRASARRLHDMVSALRDEVQIGLLARQAEDAGLRVAAVAPQFQAKTDLVAWLVDLQRPAPNASSKWP